MVFLTVITSFTITLLILASYTDLKSREVPDWISYSLLFGAFALRILFSLTHQTLWWQTILSGIIGTAFFFLIALLFFYTHQWGGADSKLLMGMGMVLGADFIFQSNSWELVLYFILLMLIGAFFGLIWSLALAFIRRKKFLPTLKHKFKEYRKEHFYAYVAAALLALLAFLQIQLVILAIFPLIAYYLFLFASAVEQSCFLKEIKPSQLTLGDWLDKDIVVRGKTIPCSKSLTKKDLVTLKRLEKEGKLHRVTIKEGVPFVPSFLLAYLTLLFAEPLLVQVLLFFF